ncbi:MAG: hypothetical protein AAF518_22410 [Spirochaetota bacterium]
MRYLSIFLLAFLASDLVAEPVKPLGKPKKRKRFVYSASEFIKPGWKFKADFGAGVQRNTKGKQHAFPIIYLLGFYTQNVFSFPYTYELVRDPIAMHNIEDFSSSSLQKESYLVVPLRFHVLYTHPEHANFSVQTSVRNTFSKQNYELYRIPGIAEVDGLRVYPGSRSYNWREAQLNLLWNEAINSWLLVQPLVGFRGELRNYRKSIQPLPYTSDDLRYYHYKEKSSIVSHQSGLRFHFKLNEAFAMTVMSKAFFAYRGQLDIDRKSLDGLQSDSYTYSKHKAKFIHEGHEHELEISYRLGNLQLYLGGNYTIYQYQETKNQYPIILNIDPGKIYQSYLDFYFQKAVYQADKDAKALGSFATGRTQYLQYFYLGVSWQI